MGAARLLIVDACVLIDFAKTDPSLLTLAGRYIGEVYVATPVLEEVEELDPAMAASLGIMLFEPSFELVAAAAADRGRLSFEDRICLLAAKENGWTCVSNDKPLRNACRAEGVSLLWGLEVLALLVEGSALSPVDAKEVAELMATQNKRLGKGVLTRFLARIG